MARQTRAQRRARRAEQERQANGADSAQQVQRAPVQRAAAPPATETERHLPGSRFRRFVGESIAELKKVEWPTQPQLVHGVAVVIIACVIGRTYLWDADLAFKRIVQHVFL